jgi:hypothetical protein
MNKKTRCMVVCSFGPTWTVKDVRDLRGSDFVVLDFFFEDPQEAKNKARKLNKDNHI